MLHLLPVFITFNPETPTCRLSGPPADPALEPRRRECLCALPRLRRAGSPPQLTQNNCVPFSPPERAVSTALLTAALETAGGKLRHSDCFRNVKHKLDFRIRLRPDGSGSAAESRDPVPAARTQRSRILVPEQSGGFILACFRLDPFSGFCSHVVN